MLAAVLAPALIVVLATQLLRGQVDAGRDIRRAVGLRAFLGVRHISAAATRAGALPDLLKPSFAGIWSALAMAVGSPSWSRSSWIGMGYSLEMAGAIFA